MSSASGKGSKKDGVGGGLVCAHCKKTGELDTMKRCGRCRLACYCSVECQKLHWRRGGHKKVCGKDRGSGTSPDGAGASGGVGAPLKHPCPICLDNEDNAGDFLLCLSCGQFICESCKESLDVRGVTNCPTCRGVLQASSAKEQVRLLHQLLARSDGRHTPVAQLNLGGSYDRGDGVGQDGAEAVRWYRLAADQENVAAQFNLGVCYDNGTGVAQDAAEAARWYRLAADQGDAGAQYNIGGCYKLGVGVVRDEAEALRWYRLAADQGDAGAQHNLGVSYDKGIEVVKDDVVAMRWYLLAADQGDSSAQFNMGVHYLHGAGVVRDVAEAERWLHLAAEQGHAKAQSYLKR